MAHSEELKLLMRIATVTAAWETFRSHCAYTIDYNAVRFIAQDFTADMIYLYDQLDSLLKFLDAQGR